MRNTVFKILLLLGALIAIAMGVALLFPARPIAPPKPLPNPNAYDVFTQAARLVDKASSSHQKFSQEELAALNASNSNALHLARSGFQYECRVPVEFTEAYMAAHLGELGGLKALAAAFSAEGRLAELEDRPADAARVHLDTIRLGTQCRRGGVLIDTLVAMVVESIGTRNLQAIVPRLDLATCRHAADVLEQLDEKREPWQAIVDQEESWARQTYPGIQYRLAALLTQRTSTKAMSKARDKMESHQANTRRLMIQLAARAYELEKGAPPKAVSDLVPGYLKTIPKDPATGTNLVYLP
jgi:hypothetical protein